ncbi:MAG: hypothetical protein K8F56_18820 [Rhodocyclaceae bacterium]|nr:hypothetical protein [Rhodocyclaceae bacterium]
MDAGNKSPSVRLAILAVLLLSRPGDSVAQLTGSWHLDEGSGTVAAETLRGRNGVVNGALWSTGPSGYLRSLEFGGASNLWLPRSIYSGFQNKAYVAAWINPTAFRPPPYPNTIFRLRAHYRDWDLSLYAGRPYVALSGLDPQGNEFALSAQSSTVVPVGQWTKLEAEYDGFTLRLWVDDEMVASDSGVLALGTTWNGPSCDLGWVHGCYAGTWIGATSEYSTTTTDPAYAFQGRIDEVRVGRSRLEELDPWEQSHTSGFECDASCWDSSTGGPTSQTCLVSGPEQGSTVTGGYPNHFSAIGVSAPQATARLQQDYQALFPQTSCGPPPCSGSRLLYFDPTATSRAFVYDHEQSVVKSEGMSYGMMIAVQMNDKPTFDRLWRWSKHYMQHKSPTSEYCASRPPSERHLCGEIPALESLFAWKCSSTGECGDDPQACPNPPTSRNPAPDAEEYIATALLFAAGRWGNGIAELDYETEANAILSALRRAPIAGSCDCGGTVRSVFHPVENQVVFSPCGESGEHTDPSYHVPAFYELWARWAQTGSASWIESAIKSRSLLRRAMRPSVRGLSPDYSGFSGLPRPEREYYGEDAWRVIGNVALDYGWFQKDTCQVDAVERLWDFFSANGNWQLVSGSDWRSNYRARYSVWSQLAITSDSHGLGQVAANAAGALAADHPDSTKFLGELWNAPNWSQPFLSGSNRYYNELLYMLAMLHVSGNFRPYCANLSEGCQGVQY